MWATKPEGEEGKKIAAREKKSQNVQQHQQSSFEAKSLATQGFHQNKQHSGKMSLVKLANVAAHLQNVTRVHLSRTSIPYTRLHLQVASHLYKQGFITSIQRGSLTGPDATPVEVTPDNISTRRLWLGLKYRDSKSVISKFQLVSKPSCRIKVSPEQMKELANGKSVRQIRPIQPSELVLVKTGNEILELGEAAAQHKGGEVLCRII